MLFAAALLPIVIYIFVVYQIDNFSLISINRLLQLIACGMVAALLCFGIFKLTGRIFSEEQSDYLNPVIEEIVKGIPLLILATRKKIVFYIDSVICGAAVGAGFSLLENVFYLLLGDGMGFGTVLFRGLEVALIHIGCSAIVAVSCMLVIRLMIRSRSKTGIKTSDIIMALSLMVIAPALHVCHNAFHFNPLMQFIFVFGSMGGLLVWTYSYDVDMIHSWIDNGLDKQLGLLDSIKNGHLNDTPTGIFLESVKEAFPAEVFFDIICYVQLHIELSVAAKCRVMIRETGLEKELPLTNEKKEIINSQCVEYKVLEKRLGSAARMTIAPIIKTHPADYKALEDLKSECKS
jgi:RsiW-degrading membrane proteinase PrsW (M82 family)